MSGSVIALLAPQQTVEDLLATRELFSKHGYSLDGVVDPGQEEKVIVREGTYVVNQLALACQICRTATIGYADSFIHSQALEVFPWKKRVS